MREPAEYGNDEVPIPVFYVLEIYQDTFRHEKPIVEIHTAEPLSPISVGDYLYEVSFPDPLAVPGGHILQVRFPPARRGFRLKRVERNRRSLHRSSFVRCCNLRLAPPLG
jgi:hypothetical protein